jgi:hypothetical protein
MFRFIFCRIIANKVMTINSGRTMFENSGITVFPMILTVQELLKLKVKVIDISPFDVSFEVVGGKPFIKIVYGPPRSSLGNDTVQ